MDPDLDDVPDEVIERFRARRSIPELEREYGGRPTRELEELGIDEALRDHRHGAS